MSFNASGLRKASDLGGFSDPKALWFYSSTDAHGTVSGSAYFAGVSVPDAALVPGGKNYGMRVGDVVLVQKSDTGATTMHSVTVVDANGDATISAAVLS